MSSVFRFLICLAVLLSSRPALAALIQASESEASGASDVIAGSEGDLKEVRDLIRGLGDRSFARRTAATDRLVEIGSMARPLLEEAARNGSPEVRGRARQILERIEISQSVAWGSVFLQNPTVETAGVLPCWKHIRHVCESDDAAVLLLEQLLRDHSDLFAEWDRNSDTFSDHIRLQCATLSEQVAANPDQPFPVARLTTLLLIAADETVEFPGRSASVISGLLRSPRMRLLLSRGEHSAVLRRLTGQWILRPGVNSFDGLQLGARHKLPEVTELAKRVLASRGPAAQKQYALLAIAKAGRAEDIAAVEAFFGNAEIVQVAIPPRNAATPAPTPRAFRTEIRDVALAVACYLRKDQDGLKSFTRLRPNSEWVFALNSPGFADESARTTAFAAYTKRHSAEPVESDDRN